MSPIVRRVKFAFNGFILFILMMCVAWLVAFIHLFMTYGIFESMVFAMGSLALISLIYGMIHHGKP